MNNILHTAGYLAKALNHTVVDKLQANIDAFIEKFDSNKPIELNNGKILEHTNSLRYRNGNLVPEYISQDELTDEQVKEAEDLYDLEKAYYKESVAILNHVKTVAIQLILLDEIEETTIHQMFFDLMPEFVLIDTDLMKELDIPESVTADLQNHTYKYDKHFPSDEKQKAYMDELRDESINELMAKYYALTLLTGY